MTHRQPRGVYERREIGVEDVDERGRWTITDILKDTVNDKRGKLLLCGTINIYFGGLNREALRVAEKKKNREREKEKRDSQ